MEVLYHDDQAGAFNKSSVDKYDGFLAVELGGVKVPVEFDYINYIDCGEVNSDSVIVNVSNNSGYTDYQDGHFVSSKLLVGDEADDIAIAMHNDDDQVVVESSFSQFKDFLSVDNGVEKVPIEYDKINYINCNKVDSDSAIVDIASNGYVYPSGSLVRAKTGINGEDMDAPSILYNEDRSGVRAHSSIDQFSTFLSAEVGGVSVPIEFDIIDYIDCGKVVSHPAIVDNGKNIGYIFSDGIHEYITDEYPLTDHTEDVLKELPEWFGDGFYQDHDEYEAITNFDGSSLGTRNVNRIRVGQNYYLADEILPAEDFE